MWSRSRSPAAALPLLARSASTKNSAIVNAIASKGRELEGFFKVWPLEEGAAGASG
jgi:hypothetical protein